MFDDGGGRFFPMSYFFLTKEIFLYKIAVERYVTSVIEPLTFGI